MNALSSTTRTPRFDVSRSVLAGAGSDDTVALLQRTDLAPPVVEMEVHAPAMIAADVLGDDLDAAPLQCLSRGGDVAVADVDPPAGQEIREHARAADELRPHAAGVRAETGHLGEEDVDRRRRELRRVGAVARHRLVW